MGAVIIEVNELEATHPKRAAWFAQAAQAAVHGHPGAYFVSIRFRGRAVALTLREHTRDGSPWESEIVLPLEAPAEEARRGVDRLLAKRVRPTRRDKPLSP